MSQSHSRKEAGAAEAASGHLIGVTVGGQLFGIPVLHAQDVLNPQRIVRIPLAPKAIAGSLNLRGRIVTAIDLRSCLGLEPCAEPSGSMSVVTERDGELYSLLVDSVGEVMTLPPETFEPTPPTLRQLRSEEHTSELQSLMRISYAVFS